MKKLLTICAVVAFALAASGQAQALEPDVWVDDDFTWEAGLDWCSDTVAGGIAKVQDGGIVYVYEGTYEEDIVIDKSLKLLSVDGAASTIIKGVANVDATEWPLAVPNIQVVGSNVEIHGFTIQGPDPVADKYSSGIVIGGDNVEIHHNVFQVTNASSTDDISQGIQTYRDGNAGAGDLDGLNIHDNTFGALGAGTHGYEAIFINHTPSGTSPVGAVTIANNQIGGALIRGVTTERSNMVITGNTVETTLDPFDAFQGILVMDFGKREQRDVAVVGNTISGGFSQGLLIGTAGQTLANISVTGNTVQGNDKGVQVRTSPLYVLVNNNKISGNATYGVENTGFALLDATNNWWGDASGPGGVGPGSGDAVSANVDFFTWCEDPDCTIFPSPYGDTDVVVVDNGWAGLPADTNVTVPFVSPGGYVIGLNAFVAIQDGIDAVDEGGTVNVLPGTYTEDLVIDKNDLEIVAVGTTIKGVANVDAAEWPLAVPNIDILGSGVEIHGFTIQGPDPVAGKYSSGIVIAGDNVEIHHNVFQVTNANSLNDISQGIQTYRDGNAGAGDLDGLNIHDNTFAALGAGTHGYEAIFINHTPSGTSPVGAVTIANNQIGGVLVRGITTERSNMAITGNTVETALDPFDGSVGALQGILVIDFGGREQKDVAVVGNTISGGFSQGLRIGMAGQTLSNISVTDNTLELNNVGVQVRASAGGVVVNNNNISGNITCGVENTDAGNSLDATLNWWGNVRGPHHATANPGGQGNEVSDNVDFVPWLNAPGGGVFTGVFIDTNANDAHDDGEPIFATIQDAIDAASEGDIILVEAATYEENLVIDKSGITIRSEEGSDETTLSHQSSSKVGVDFRSGADNCVLGGEAGHGFTMVKDSAGFVIQLTNAPSGVEISHNTIDNTGSSSMGINIGAAGADGLQVIENEFIAEHGDGSIYGWSASNMTVCGNTFAGPSTTSGYAVQLSGMSASYITNNTIDGYGTGIFLQNVEGPAGVSDVTISNNRIRDCAKGIRLGYHTCFSPGGCSDVCDVTVTDNELSFNTVGIYVSDNVDSNTVVAADTFVIKDNIIAENTDGLKNDNDVYVVDATLNWWGDPSGPSGEGPGSGDTVSVMVDYDPWWVCGDTVHPCPIGDLNHDDQVNFADFALFADNWLEGATP